jgi:Cu/Ag efflux protein CusF
MRVVPGGNRLRCEAARKSSGDFTGQHCCAYLSSGSSSASSIALPWPLQPNATQARPSPPFLKNPKRKLLIPGGALPFGIGGLRIYWLNLFGGYMKQIYRSVSAFILSVPLAGCGAQTTQNKKSYTFHGKVEAVDANDTSLKVNGEEVKGWMDAMTMDYKVDDPSVLKKVSPGDQIMATVYDGDFVLHKVQVMPKKVQVMPKQNGESNSKK